MDVKVSSVMIDHHTIFNLPEINYYTRFQQWLSVSQPQSWVQYKTVNMPHDRKVVALDSCPPVFLNLTSRLRLFSSHLLFRVKKRSFLPF